MSKELSGAQFSSSDFGYLPLPQGDGVSKAAHMGLRTYRTNLRPNTAAGIFCPGGTIVNHETSSLRKTIVLTCEVALHFLLLISQIFRLSELLQYENSILDHQDELTSDDIEVVKETILNEEYLSEDTACLLDCVIHAWLVWNIGIRLFYFAFYRPRYQEEAYKPTLFTKVFFPLATVYYHEGNQACNHHFGLTYLCGFLYPVLCYEPSYEVIERLA